MMLSGKPDTNGLRFPTLPRFSSAEWEIAAELDSAMQKGAEQAQMGGGEAWEQWFGAISEMKQVIEEVGVNSQLVSSF
eukprot:1197946-Rhodomonas_salina.1